MTSLYERYAVDGKMATMAPELTTGRKRSVRDDMLAAAVDLLNEHGPDELQTRKVAGAAGTSTMAVYTHFGGMQGLIAEVAQEGLRQFDTAQLVPRTDDPVADLIATGAAYRRYAIERPHMYRLMFGSTSAHGITAPVQDVLTLKVAQVEQDCPSFAHVVRGVDRCMRAGRFPAAGSADDATVIATAAQFWSQLHGFVMLELAGFYGDVGAAAGPVLDSMMARLLVALGDPPEKVAQSQQAAKAAH